MLRRLEYHHMNNVKFEINHRDCLILKSDHVGPKQSMYDLLKESVNEKEITTCDNYDEEEVKKELFPDGNFNKMNFNDRYDTPDDKKWNELKGLQSKSQFNRFKEKYENCGKSDVIKIPIESSSMRKFLAMVPDGKITKMNLELLLHIESRFKKDDDFGHRFSVIDFFVQSDSTKKNIIMGLVQSAKTILFSYIVIIHHQVFGESSLIIAPVSSEIMKQIEDKIKEHIDDLKEKNLIDKIASPDIIDSKSGGANNIKGATDEILNPLKNNKSSKKIIITMNEKKRVEAFSSFLELNTINIKNVYIDEGDTMICSKLSDDALFIYNKLGVQQDRAEIYVDNLTEIDEDEYSKKISDENYTRDGRSDFNEQDDDDSSEEDSFNEIDQDNDKKILMSYRTSGDDSNREYIVKIVESKCSNKYFEQIQVKVGDIGMNQDSYDLPKLQKSWEDIFDKMKSKRICYITSTFRSIVNYETEKTSLFYLRPENTYHSPFFKNDDVPHKFINIIDCQKWMRNKKNKALDIQKMKADEKAKLCCNIYDDAFKKITYDISSNRNIMLPYYSLLINGVEHVKTSQKKLRNNIFKKLIEDGKIDSKYKDGEETYVNDEYFGIWIVNSDKNSDFIFSSVKDYFKKLTDFKEKDTNRKKIHILITDDMNKRGVVNRPDRKTCNNCDGGHFIAVYPKKGGHLANFENLLQRVGRSCNNSSGIFCKSSEINGRKSPEMYVYMDNYARQLLQILSQDIALCYYFIKTRNEENLHDGDFYLKNLLNSLPNKPGFDKYWESLVTNEKNSQALVDSRPKLNVHHTNRRANNTFKVEKQKMFTPNVDQPTIPVIMKALQYRSRIKGTDDEFLRFGNCYINTKKLLQERQQVQLLENQLATAQNSLRRNPDDKEIRNIILKLQQQVNDKTRDQLSDEDLNFYFPIIGYTRSFPIGDNKDYIRDTLLPKMFFHLFGEENLENLEFFYILEEQGVMEEYPKLIEPVRVNGTLKGTIGEVAESLAERKIFSSREKSKTNHKRYKKNKRSKDNKYSFHQNNIKMICKFDHFICQQSENIDGKYKQKVNIEDRLPHTVYKTFDIEQFVLELDTWYEYIDVEETEDKKYKMKFEFVRNDFNDTYKSFDEDHKKYFSIFFQLFINLYDNLIRFFEEPNEENITDIVKIYREKQNNETNFLDKVAGDGRSSFFKDDLQKHINEIFLSAKLSNPDKPIPKLQLWKFTTPRKNGNSKGVLFVNDRDSGKYRLKDGFKDAWGSRNLRSSKKKGNIAFFADIFSRKKYQTDYMDLFHKWLLNNDDDKTLKNLKQFSITRIGFENEIRFKHNNLRNQFTNPGGDNGKDNFSKSYIKLLTLKEKEEKYVIDPNLYESIEQGFLRFKERIYADLEQADDLTENEKEKAVLVTKGSKDFCITQRFLQSTHVEKTSNDDLQSTVTVKLSKTSMFTKTLRAMIEQDSKISTEKLKDEYDINFANQTYKNFTTRRTFGRFWNYTDTKNSESIVELSTGIKELVQGGLDLNFKIDDQSNAMIKTTDKPYKWRLEI